MPVGDGSRGTTDKPLSGAIGDQRGRVRNVAPLGDRDVLMDGSLNDDTGVAEWAVQGDDTVNLATHANHVTGRTSLEFDKVDGAANTKLAGFFKTDGRYDLSRFLEYDAVEAVVYLSAITNVASVHLRLGKDASNYNEWTWDDAGIQVGAWHLLSMRLGSSTMAVTGSGWDPRDVKYVAFLVEFDAETDALADVRVDTIRLRSVQGAPHVLLNTVNLSSVAASTDGDAVDTARFEKKTVYVTVSGNTGAVTVNIEHSPDGSAPWHALDSKTYTAVNANDSWSYKSHFPFMRTTATALASATVKTTITGKGA